MTANRQKLSTASIVLMATVLPFCSCSRKVVNQAKGGGPVPVLVAQAEERDVPVEIRSIGNVEAYSTVTIRAQITGMLTKVHFKEGQEVKAGDLLFTIDSRTWEATLNQARANTKRDQAQLNSARLDFERTKKLMESSIASRDDYDKAEAAFLSAEAVVASDNAAISNAELSLEYTAIRSPIDGRTGNLMIKEGNIVKAEDDQLVTINQIHPIYVTFSVPEKSFSTVHSRMKGNKLVVRAVASGETNNVAVGELTFIDNSVDATTGTILLKATFPNTDTRLWPGQFVETTLTLSSLSHATVVPSQAVQTSQSGDFVFVVKPDSTVEKRNVTTSILRDGIMVIESGVKPGETVVTDGQMKLAPGAKVNPQKLEAAQTGAQSGSTNKSETRIPKSE